jgi:signal transduction histidine kinase
VRLRRRLNTVLLQWFLLLVIVAAVLWLVSVPGLRRHVVDDRLLLARTIAHSLDITISESIQSLGRLASDLPPPDQDPTGRLRAFRFQSPFGEASYILDDRGDIVAADPAGVRPIPAEALGQHEAVTPLIQKVGASDSAVLAIVQPFRRAGRPHYLVAEMRPTASMLNAFLKDLETDPTMQILVVDENGVVVASDDAAQVLRTIAGREAFSDRIRAHRPVVIEGATVPFWPTEAANATLTVMAPLQFASWGVIVQQPTAYAFAGLNTISRGLLLTALLLAAMGVLLARTLSRSVVQPIRQLSRQAEAMRAGDLSTTIAVSGDHEIEVLATTLDEARVRLASTLTELQAFNERLESEVAARTRVIVQQDEQRKILVRRLLGATEDERRRLARELHDEIAQLLTVIQLTLHHMHMDTPEMQRANALLVKTQEDIHRIIHDLRPTLLDDLGLSTAMKAYAKEHLMRQGLAVNLEIEDLPSRPEIETVIFRIYQELITNILRHAGAENVSVELYEQDRKVVLAVEDDGKGFDPEAKSDRAGLTGMRERASLVNGTITFDSEPGEGTRVVLEIPLQ